jgi:Ca2+-transporting ATPase
VIVFLSAINTYSRERQFESLDVWKTDSESVVMRSGKVNSNSKYDLVVGDILILTEGNIVPADCVLLRGALVVDQSHFTHAQEWAKKAPYKWDSPRPLTAVPSGSARKLSREIHDDPFLVSGSKVMRGRGEALVCAVGRSSQAYGKRQEVEGKPKPTLQTKLNAIADS